MVKHNFKIGDKVRLKNPKRWSIGTRIGEVVGFDRLYVRVTWDATSPVYRDYPQLSREIEHVVKVGEQLLFAFMDN